MVPRPSQFEIGTPRKRSSITVWGTQPVFSDRKKNGAKKRSQIKFNKTTRYLQGSGINC